MALTNGQIWRDFMGKSIRKPFENQQTCLFVYSVGKMGIAVDL
jgi:hypothetical protein